MQINVIIVQGPTASGKSKFSLDLAQKLDAIIINADSMQWYKGLPILTAHPTPAEQSLIPHIMFGKLNLNEQGTVARWVNEATTHITQAAKEKKWSIVVGGTGLYLKALTHGLSYIPEITQETKDTILNMTKSMTLNDLQNYVYEEDSILHQNNPPVDKQRLIRALEIKHQTGKSIREFQNLAQPILQFDKLFNVTIHPDKNTLHDRMHKRIFQMLEMGLLNEIKDFWTQNPSHTCPLRKVVGLEPFTRYILNDLSLENAIELTFIQTRQYGKRQLTWIKNQSSKHNAYINPDIEMFYQHLTQ